MNTATSRGRAWLGASIVVLSLALGGTALAGPGGNGNGKGELPEGFRR